MKIRSSAPGRICLFGEHQDYLGFPVIAAAIDLRITIRGQVRAQVSGAAGRRIKLELPDMAQTMVFDTDDICYAGRQDYLKSVVNVLKKKGLYRPRSIEATVKGNVPIKAGTSSSAALSVAWAGFLLKALANLAEKGDIDVDEYLDNPSAISELAYLAEVEEFNESGGRMDQYTSAVGGIVYLDFYGNMTVTSLPAAMKEFVLGDSLQPKDTQKTLKRVRTAQEGAFRYLSLYLEFKDNYHVRYEKAEPFIDKIPPGSRPYLEAALMNHKITNQAKRELLNVSPDIQQIARLMNRHQAMLRDNLKVSTPRIDVMIERAMEAGALAGKINGSGEGGCMFAFCPGRQQEVAGAIERAGGVPYIINIGKGLEVEEI
jgi:galactokinase